MAEVCSINQNNAKLSSLEKFCGTDVAQFLEYFSKAFVSNPQDEALEPRDKFKKWYKKQYKQELDINSMSAVQVKDAIIKYYEYLVPTYKATEVQINHSRAAMFGYTSPLARKKALAYVSMLIYKDYMNTERNEDNITDNILGNLATENIQYLRDMLASMLSENNEEKYQDIWENLTTNCGEYIDELIRENAKSNEPYSDAILNWMALYKELTSTYKENPTDKSEQTKAFDEIQNSKLITSLKLSRYDTLDDLDDATNNALNAVEDEGHNDAEEAGNEDKVNTTIRDHNLHHGEVDDFKKHITERVRRILNTIPKLNSPVPRANNETYKVETEEQDGLDLKIDPAIGFPEYHDATEIATLLYVYVDKDDAESMAESIRIISETFPEYAGLSVLANQLESDRDLRYAFFTNFGKQIISKAQTVLSDGIVRYRVSNPNANRLDTLRAQYKNEFVSSCINVNFNDVKEAFDKLLHLNERHKQVGVLAGLNKEVGRSAKVDRAIKALYDQLKLFYPSLSHLSLVNFVYNNPGVSIQEAINSLYSDLKSAVDSAESIQKAVKAKQDAIKSANEYNRTLMYKIRTKKIKAEDAVFKDVVALKKKDPIEARHLKSPMAFAEHMTKFTLIKANINSVNVHGNQSSDVLNSSLITRLKSIFENPEKGKDSPLQLLADDYHLNDTMQYRLSNILIEQDGHPGIFKLVNGHYVPTEYANDLLQFTLFNGAINQDTETPVLYSEMSKGDYIGTSWSNFFSDVDSTIEGRNIKLGRYFLRIPSDAPKTFILRAPRYLVNQEHPLFATGNQGEFDEFVNNVTKKLLENNRNIADNLIAYFGKAAVVINDDAEFMRHISSTGESTINIADILEGEENDINIQLLKIKEFAEQQIAERKKAGEQTENVVLMFVKTNSDDTAIPYLMEGKYVNGRLYNAKFSNTLNMNENLEEGNTKGLHDLLYKNFEVDFVEKNKVEFGDLSVVRQRIVNKDHQLFKQLKSVFKQELIDAVDAIRLMFKTQAAVDGNRQPIIRNGKQVLIITRDKKLRPVLKEEWAKDTNGLSPIYHIGKKGEVLKENGKLAGRVFESDRFVVFDEEDNVVRNYGQELLDTVLIYMTTTKNSNINNLVTWTEVNGKFELNLTSDQELAIEDKIQEFINDFVDNSYVRLQSKKDFLRGKALNFDNVADYMLNHHLMYVNSNDLLEGDTKYYSDVQTFLKRTKEYQASGNPYGIASIKRTLTTSPVEKIQIGPAAWCITLTDRFNAITFHTTKKFRDSVLTSLEHALTNKKLMGVHAMSEEDAKNIMRGNDGEHGYTDAKVNDAQSYITFEEWVRRVAARGELDKYMHLITKIMNGEQLTPEDLTEFIQVQKNIYYDLYYDPVTNRKIPRQIKNAEFVLVPQFIEGTELKEVYDFMKANDIHQINTDETSKAANGYIVDIFDKNGNLKQEVIDSNEGKTNKKTKAYKELVTKAIQPYSYNYLYEQQKVPQHMFANNKFAIQIAKKIIDNIQKDHPLAATKQEYFDLMTANIKDSFKSLMKDFNIPVDDNGNLITDDPSAFENIDFEKFYNKLKVELGRLGLDDNSLDYATLTENPFNPSETVMPNYIGMMINKLESIIQSVVTKAVTRQTLHGFHAAQITNIGYVELASNKEQIGYDSSLKYHEEGYYNEKTGEYLTNEEYEARANKSGFEKATLPYVEVMLPYSAFGIDKTSAKYKDMTDEEIIAELHEKGLDVFIGYRIPTEGKQSTAVMKLTKFIPDGYGSTIVLPIEWVPQTGSDFDVDSVYGIMHKVYIAANGEVHKIEYIGKGEFNRYNWFDYVRRNSEENIKEAYEDLYEDTKGMTKKLHEETKKSAKAEGKSAVKAYRAKLQEKEQEAYKKLPGKYFYQDDKPVYIGPKGKVVQIHKMMDEHYGKAPSREKYMSQLANEIDLLSNHIRKEAFSQEEFDAIEEYLNIIKLIHAGVSGSTEEEANIYSEARNKKFEDTLNEIRESQVKAYQEIAEEEGLMNEEEFLATANENPIDYNSRTARDNQIVTDMIKILSHPLSLEEQLSRSNFDNIAGIPDFSSVDKLRSEVETKRRKNRSPFNILDEADFQEDAMQGFALKGFSVSRDTFCSVCNTVRPTIDNQYAPTIAYDFSNLSDKEFTKKLNELKARYNDEGQENVWNRGKVIVVRHNKIGWSNGNTDSSKGELFSEDRNIDGKITTIYSSQTTAHILDAMKSGPVPNVNKYTFGVYKTLVDIGSRYDTAIGFIMHPAIAAINEHYDKTNSIYATDTNTKYIDLALNDYCDKLAKLDSRLKFKKRATLEEKLQEINKIYHTAISTDYMNNTLTAIDEEDIKLRINDEEAYKKKVGGDIYICLNDMAHVLHFAKLMELTNNINSVQQVTNPDKFGAKQSIFETERVFNMISDYIKSKWSYDAPNKRWINHSVLKVDGKDILEAIYPDFVTIDRKYEDSFRDDLTNFVSSTTNVAKSKYPTLCAHLKYGSATSIIVNSMFFVTQTPQFKELINSLERNFSNNKRLDEKTYIAARSYMINSLYKYCGFLNSPLNYVKGKGFQFKDENREINSEEVARIYGYSRTVDFSVPVDRKVKTDSEGRTIVEETIKQVTIEDVNNPTKKQIEMFALLSPAQKIEFIRGRFQGESIFDYISTRLYTTTDTRNTSAGAQLVSFVESSADIDYLRDLFYKAFTNSNPLIAMTAADMIKYAFIVDGYMFTRNGISKLIPNSLLLNDGPFAGTNIIPEMNEKVSFINSYLDDNDVENFIRANKNLSQINTRRVKKSKGEFELSRRKEGMIFITPIDSNLASTYGVVDDNGVHNSYVRLKFEERPVLYKIWSFDTGYYVLTPLNDLEKNENANWSANSDNNIYPGKIGDYDYYASIMEEFENSRNPEQQGFATADFERIIEKTNSNDFRGMSYVVFGEKPTREFNVKADSPLGQNLINRATEIINDSNKPYRFFYTLQLDSYIGDKPYIHIAIPTKHARRGNVELNAPTIFTVTKVDISKLYKYFVKPSLDRSELNQEQRDILESLETEMQTRSIAPKFSHMFKIEEKTTNLNNTEVKRIKFSTVGQTVTPIVNASMAVVKGVNYIGTVTGEEEAAALSRNFRSQNVFSKAEVVEHRVEDIIIPAAKTLEKTVQNLEYKLKNFMPKDDGSNEYWAITDPEVIKVIKKDATWREKYLKAIMDPGAIESQFAIFRDLNIDSESEQLRPYLNKIKDSVKRLRDNEMVADAQKAYVYDVLDKLSNRPDIKNGIVHVIDGYFKQSTLNALFNDIQESPSALVQVTMKMIQDNLRASELQTQRDLENFVTHIEDIKARAAAAGKSINYDNIIDEYGRFKRHYKQKLIEDRTRLQKARDDKRQHWIAVRDSKPNYELSVESVQAYLDYQKANLEYEEWKAKYIEQPAYNEHNNKLGIEDDGYYNTRNYLTRTMLDNEESKYIFAVYQILKDKRRRLYARQLPDVDNPELDKELEELDAKISGLSMDSIADDITHTSIPKKNYGNIIDDAATMIKRAWNDKGASALLKAYEDSFKRNEFKYWKYEPKASFDQQVKDNQAIVRKYEKPDEDGIPTVSQAELANNEDYLRAKRWLRRNATPLYVVEGDSSWVEEYAEAMEILHNTSEGLSEEFHRVYTAKKFRDENGDLDGIEISKDSDLINKIRKSQQITYNVFRENDFSDRTLISLAPTDDLIYSEEFWKNISNGKKELKDEYKQTITTINNILAPYYNERTNAIDWEKLFEYNTPDQVIAILTSLDALYSALDDMSKGTGNGKETAEFIESTCDTQINESRYAADLTFASTLPNNEAGALFRRLIQGHHKDDAPGNSYLYKSFGVKHADVFRQLASFTDKESQEYKDFVEANKTVIDMYSKYVDLKKTRARRIVNQYSYKTNTKYYYMAREQALKEAEEISKHGKGTKEDIIAGKKHYKDWFFKNHVYNPYTRKFEPIAIWRKTAINSIGNSNVVMEWQAGYSQTNRVVRDGYVSLGDIDRMAQVGLLQGVKGSKFITEEGKEFLNKYIEDFDYHNGNYKEGLGHGENYKFGTNAEYDNPDTRNDFEKEMSEYMQNVINRLTEDEASQHYIQQGWLPSRMKREENVAKFVGKELKNLAGLTAYDSGKDEETPIVDYAHDKYIPTPMLAMVTKLKEVNKLKRPIREEFDTEEEYLAKKQEWDAEEARIKAKNMEAHKMYHDKDYEGVMKEFITRANRHNTIQHNKMNFYMAQELLGKYGAYRQRYGKEGSFKKDGAYSDAEQAEYLKQIDEDMYKQFTTTIRRFVNNEWKSPEGSLTRYMSLLQAMTSAKFMILNHKGGIANITYGEASIHSESKAAEFFEQKHSIQGLNDYRNSIIDNFAHMYSDVSTTAEGAIIKAMNIVDYDEITGLTHITGDLDMISKKLNDFAYSAQTMGEHAMQNRIMFAMMRSHRIFLNPRHEEFGEPKYTFMTLKQYMEGKEEEALLEILTPAQAKEYKDLKEKIAADANKYKDFAWYRDDFVWAYARSRLSWAKQAEFRRLKKDKLKNARKEFEDDTTHPTIRSQIKLGDNGKMSFVEGSLLAEMDNMVDGHVNTSNEVLIGKPSDAIKFLGQFKGRVISVNKKIHGAYDKSGRAKVENQWWGSVLMQYHKHLPIGLSKRYRSKGYFNEERGSREKGSYVSLLDFVETPFRKQQTLLALGDQEVEALEGVQNIIKAYLDFVFHLRTAIGVMPEYDKANVRRVLADFEAMFGALAACVALKMIASDDDRNRWWYNFLFYQTDRLASESAQYMPWVLPTELKKFYSNPIAGFKEVDDITNTASAITQMIMGSVGLSDFEPTYDSGPNAGRYKMAVYIERNIPFWRGIRSAYIDINDNNKAYKAGKNVLGFFDTDILAEKGKKMFK